MSSHNQTDTIRLRVIDSHTGGEPTRFVVSGGPELSGPISEQLITLKRDFDRVRRMVLGEPRGAEHMVGAMLCTPHDPRCAAGVIFFNNVGYLGMCGHGLMGVMVSLAYMGKLSAGKHLIETSVGVVEAEISDGNSVTIYNVPSYRHAEHIAVDVPGFGTVHGDIAWGGNWFFLVHDHGLPVEPSAIPRLTEVAIQIRDALAQQGITGANNGYIDHIEMMTPTPRLGINSRSFVLCPGGAYDRSPCGTGTSAVIACEHAAGRLKINEVWQQESVIGSTFAARLVERDGQIVPCLTGTAYVNGDAQLIADPNDPFAWGIP